MPLPDPPPSDAEVVRRRLHRAAFGDVVREARRDAEMSQEELAMRAEVSRPTIARVEAGAHSITLDRLWAVAEALGVDAATLIARTQDKAVDMAEREPRRGTAWRGLT